jgi:penicillin-binding protein 2
MRNPFHLKNGIDSEDWLVQEKHESISFEESLADVNSRGVLEREQDSKSRFGLIIFLVVAIFGLVIGRLYYLTVTKHDYYLEIARGNRLRIEYFSAPRGAIYDSHDLIIAANKPSFELVASPLDLPQDPGQLRSVVGNVAEILQIDPSEIESEISGQHAAIYQSILVKSNLTRDQALIFQERESSLPGFQVINAPIRDYKTPEAYAHAVGYVGKISADEYDAKSSQGYLYNDFLGKTGLEQTYEDYLRGKFGQQQVQVDARGVVQQVFGEIPAQPGDNLHLNLDDVLQQELFTALSGRLKTINKTRAAAIAVNPQNGKVLAYVSLPSFDNNLFAGGIDVKDYASLTANKNQPLFNRAIQGTYPPGSTVKPMIASAALQESVITPQTVLDDSGFLRIRNVYGGPDSLFYGYNHSGLGPVDVRRAIAVSSDIFFYMVGGGYTPAGLQGMGIDRLDQYFKDYHLGSPLGIDLPGEAGGLVPTPAWKAARFPNDPLAAKWYLGDTYHVSIGQGDLLVTPLQLLSWISTIANGGKIYQPYLVDHITDNQGKLVKQFEPQVLGTVPIDAQNLQIAREGMREAVTGGTAKSLNTLSIEVAAKTGTAQFDSRDLSRTHAWFSAFAPYDNPQIAIVVLIEDGGEGGINAVPVVRQVLDWWAKNRYNK